MNNLRIADEDMHRLKPALCSISWRYSTGLMTIIDLCANLGIHGLEIWLPHLAAVSPIKVRDALKEKRIEAVCLSVPWGARFWEHGNALVHYASTVGARGIKVFGDTFNAADNLPGKLREFAEAAAVRGLEVYLETHDGQPHDTVDHCLALYQKAASKNVRFIFDLFNTWFLKEDLTEAYGRLAPLIAHFHLKWGVQSPETGYSPKPLAQAPISFSTVLAAVPRSPIWCSLEMASDEGLIRDNLAWLQAQDQS
ncbi:MAG: hypothetical protein A2487_03725 [Candidatus Raymondbacteria bacterium RifOxyC12_full_50_8]|uniref:Xylose isomerase-like TIM barrel domain-containing protein n=1 Tax=Candidatus Raymondbacteria bacterium RIFOXYD12_FULL_49_13 TaxID=1817890 RepID=A0A1F7FIS4_UNCRA|nr:MAG: hypothetical protein A2248_10215 [Candidatus Raymondbacteria bacterium RIFOXYA2_FULL_49_16]OGJ99618.1 MAG: hypothetical protein A2350_06040 [Candidatus Raymondbacteria bacterium RifOxyB12_full_50_8]OGK06634.1 MAG: hypothetical protein A2519_11015 [Candidatus Raymondbacteria bacterium RIFOXYD12_FULL_49_13]OGK06688.1 MAG: hypothetical protein A2487_03725 [Candidatus Raymondbacteria bacterium RifOxyC12_full_50_8]OGP43428.1 MAG: hypothetical protein A2324_20035 [Candidatus Raymondbacteria b